jgi:signal transduction histidine kinase/ActR/RegA family two-component response regulator
MLTDQTFTAAFHSSPIGQYLLAPTDKLEILAVNDAFLRSVARRREDVQGKPLFEAFPLNPHDPEDTGAPDLAQSIRTAIESGVSQLMPVQRYPIEMHKDGRSWFENMYWSATNTPVYGADGALLCISHTTIDITARVLAQEALRASQEEALRNASMAEADRAYLDGVLRATPVGIMVVDQRGRFLHSNPANEALFGPGIPAPDGRVDFDGWAGWIGDGEHKGEKLAPADWPLHRALGGKASSRLLEIASFGPTRARRILLVSAAPVINPEGGLVGAVAASMDIEDRVRAEQALKDADRRKDEFLAMLAHELRNPLAPIGAAASLLLMGKRDHGVEQVRRTSAVIARQVQHMSALIDDLLDVSRVTRGLITLERTVLDAKRIVAEALEQARPGIEARRHMLQVRQPPMPAFVEGDRKRLVQVLVNLLNNAAKFTPDGGQIEFELAIDPHHVRMSVSDNGIGMTPEMQARGFDLFVQAERTSDRSQGGLGIGLALVRGLVSLHDGHVSVHSDGPGRGSRFTICLPKVDEGHDDARDEHTHLAEQRAVLSVMLVDDNEDALVMLDMLVASLGHRTVSFAESPRALAAAPQIRPDVFLLDIGLPEIDGLALARALRADPRTSQATLIAVSGYGQDADRRAAFEAGFDEYFVKPLDVGGLTAVLSRLRPVAARQAPG